MDVIFSDLAVQLASEEALRDELRALRQDVEKALQPPAQLLNLAHHQLAMPDKQHCLSLLASVGQAMHAMMAKVPTGSYYKYCGLFNQQLQTMFHLVVLEEFLLTEGGDDASAAPPRLPDLSKVRLVLQLPEGNPLPIEDYLIGVCNAISEISRLCVTRVPLGDYEFARRVSSFASGVFASFQLLNFRNDFLRRKYDGMKYDIKRVEDVVYDLSVRKLLSPSS